MEKKERRQRRARKTRAKIRQLAANRLCIHRTPRLIYALGSSPDSAIVMATASTVSKDLRKSLKSTGNKEAAVAVGKLIAERAKAAGVEKVAFDRSGFNYHGRVKALAEAAREAGLDF